MKMKQAEFEKVANECNKDLLRIVAITGFSRASVYRRLALMNSNTSNTVTVKTFTDTITPTANTTPETHNFDLSYFIPKDDGIQYDTRPIVDNSLELWSWTLNTMVCLVGEAGSGKNYAVRELAKRHNVPYICISCDNDTMLKRAMGYWQAVNGQTIWREGILAQAMKRPSVILIDEPNLLPPAKLGMLHELRDNRRLYIQDAPADKSIINAHPECRFILAMNPPSNKYTGTNRLNCALATGVTTIEVPNWNLSTVKIEAKEYTDKLRRYFIEISDTIRNQGLRVAFCRRHIERICKALKHGADIKQALLEGFINSALLTASQEEKQALINIAIPIFGDLLSNSQEVK